MGEEKGHAFIMIKLLSHLFRHDFASGRITASALGEDRSSLPSVPIPASMPPDQGGVNEEDFGFRFLPVQLVQIMRIVFAG